MFLSKKPSGSSCPTKGGESARTRGSRVGLVIPCVAFAGLAFALALSGAAMTFVSVSSEHRLSADARSFSSMITPTPGYRSARISSAVLAGRDRAARAKAARLEVAEDAAAGFDTLAARLNEETAQANRTVSIQKAAEIALAAELAKRVLTRRLLAARGMMPDAAPDATPGEAPVRLASLEVEADDGGDVLEVPLAVEPEPKPSIEIEAEVETETQGNGGRVAVREEVEVEETPTVAALLPEIAPVPQRRPDVRVAARQSTGKPAVLAYARAEDPEDDEGGVFSGLKKVFRSNDMAMPGRGSGVAVYDIKAAVVYMPDGQKLEAHSGLGHMKDNPNYVDRRMVGPTPPNIYNLRMREARFHGVEAIRMLPTDRDAMNGRDGILAHTYMLRGTNGSNGCLVFKHYDRFLAAFKAGKVNKIIVVPDLSHLPTYMASL
ncbi:DUF2778 domain-containing protein [Breoghania sp. JC706]|uniref:DUF2778 domain-containing protein n=1 Tax=Breoghania sp. JC706 TaxID=3117732 RepID=UPI003009ED28